MDSTVTTKQECSKLDSQMSSRLWVHIIIININIITNRGFPFLGVGLQTQNSAALLGTILYCIIMKRNRILIFNTTFLPLFQAFRSSIESFTLPSHRLSIRGLGQGTEMATAGAFCAALIYDVDH